MDDVFGLVTPLHFFKIGFINLGTFLNFHHNLQESPNNDESNVVGAIVKYI